MVRSMQSAALEPAAMWVLAANLLLCRWCALGALAVGVAPEGLSSAATPCAPEVPALATATATAAAAAAFDVSAAAPSAFSACSSSSCSSSSAAAAEGSWDLTDLPAA